jgi:hypothetical protein
MASVMSTVIAHAKQQTEIQLPDVIAGIYVANFDRVLRFWPDPAAFEDFIAEHCGWSENRIATWDRWRCAMRSRTVSVPFTGWFFNIPQKHSIIGRSFTYSDVLKRTYSTAEHLSPNKVSAFEKVVPLITPELFLLATVHTDGVELGKRLVDAGLRIDELAIVATKQLDFPEKLHS